MTSRAGRSGGGDGDCATLQRAVLGGTIEPWKVAAHTPSPVTECTVAADITHIYLLDGIYDDVTKQGNNFTASFLDGVVGSFNQTGTLPSGDDLFDDLAFVLGGNVVAVTSKLTGSCALLCSTINSQQTGWLDNTWFLEFRGRPQWANAFTSDGQFAYVIGGYSDDAGNVALATGEGTTINAAISGGFVPMFNVSVTPLPTPTTFGMAGSADDYVFVAGGRSAIFGAPARADVLSAQATAPGALGAWTVQPSLPAPRSNGAAVVGGNFLYVLGGADTSDTTTVFAAQVRF